MAVDYMTCFWLDRILLMCLIYCAVEGNKKHLFNSLVALIFHDFIVFTVKRPLRDAYAFISTMLNNSKDQNTGMIMRGNYIYNCVREKEEFGSSTRVEKNEEEKVARDNCKEEAIKTKGKYKEKYKRKLMIKEEKLERVKSSLKDKYIEERDKWEEERKVLKKKYEELRWT